jgi:MFS family permease
MNQKIFLNLEDFRTIVRRAEIGKLIGLYFFIIFAASNIYATFPIYGVKNFGMTDREVGLIFGIIGFFGALMQGGVIRHAVKYMNEKRVFLIGTIVTTAGFVALAAAPSIALLYVAAMIYSIGSNTVMPTGLSLISQNTEPSEQGSILGINQSLSSLARVLGPISGGFLFQHVGHVWPFISGAAVMTVVATLTVILYTQMASSRRGGSPSRPTERQLP